MAAHENLLLELPTESRETSPPDYHPYNKIQPKYERSKVDLAITAAKRVRPKKSSTFPCSVWLETKAKVSVFCVNWQNCKFEEEREWQGQIIGRGIHGCLNALLSKIKYKNRASKTCKPLIGLLTNCAECSREIGWSDDDQLDQIIKRTPGSLVLSGKEVEEILSTKVIIMEGYSWTSSRLLA
jgi:hypothetical protein